jgi:hypothetical protein
MQLAVLASYEAATLLTPPCSLDMCFPFRRSHAQVVDSTCLSLYCGFDPTADSLHLGELAGAVSRFCRPVCLLDEGLHRKDPAATHSICTLRMSDRCSLHAAAVLELGQ